MPARALDRLEAWGADLVSDPRLFPGSAIGGVAIFALFRVVLAMAMGAPPDSWWIGATELTAGALTFAAFWGGAGIVAAAGFPRVLLAGLMGHLVGFVVAAVNVANAARSGFETTLALLTLFELTLIGVAFGVALELVLAARRRYARPPSGGARRSV